MSKLPSLSPALAGELRHFVNRRGHRVAYYKSPPQTAVGDDARPIVLVHSINAAASAYEMRPLFARFARPTYALEWPGYGQSQRGPLRYEADLYTETLREFLELVQPSHGAADVVALSLSAEHAASVARERPDLVHTLTLISPTGLALSPPPARRLSRWVDLGLRNKPWSHLVFNLLCSHASLHYFLSKSFASRVPDQGLLAYAYESSHQPGAEHAPFAFLGGHFAVPDVFGRVYAQLATPTMILYDEDAYTSFERIDELVLRNPAVCARRILRTRGLPHWERPEQTAAALTEHWRLYPIPAAAREGSWRKVDHKRPRN